MSPASIGGSGILEGFEWSEWPEGVSGSEGPEKGLRFRRARRGRVRKSGRWRCTAWLLRLKAIHVELLTVDKRCLLCRTGDNNMSLNMSADGIVAYLWHVECLSHALHVIIGREM